MTSPEVPKSWIDKTTGASTQHAEKFAAETKTQLSELSDELKAAIPAKTALNMPEYTVVKDDGILAVLAKKIPAGKFTDRRLLRLAYGHMFKQAKEQGENINLIRPNEKLIVQNGKLTVTRKNGSTFTVDIYPWTEGSRPKPPPKSTPKDKPPAKKTRPAVPPKSTPRTAPPNPDPKALPPRRKRGPIPL